MNTWNRQVQSRMERTVWNTGGCTSWYLDANGLNTTVWPGTTGAFRRETRTVDLAEYEVVRRGGEPRPERVAATPASGTAPTGRTAPTGPTSRAGKAAPEAVPSGAVASGAVVPGGVVSEGAPAAAVTAEGSAA